MTMIRLAKTSFGNNLLRMGFLLIIAGFVCYWAAERVTIAQLARTQISVTPFVLEMDLRTHENNANGKIFQHKTVARRSDGSTAVVTTFGPVELGNAVRKITFMDGMAVTLADLIRSKTTITSMEKEIAALKQRLTDTNVNCRNSEKEILLGHEVLWGQDVSVVSMRLPDNQEIIYWRAPNLGCENLRYVVEYKEPNSYRRRTTAEPVKLTLGQPDATFFEINSGFVETKPSDVLKNVAGSMGVSLGLDDLEKAKEWDDRYKKSKP